MLIKVFSQLNPCLHAIRKRLSLETCVQAIANVYSFLAVLAGVLTPD